MHSDSDEEENDLQLKEQIYPKGEILPKKKRNFVLYYLINDFSMDFIYGYAFSIALTNDYIIGGVIILVIFTEGFRRHSRRVFFARILLENIFWLI